MKFLKAEQDRTAVITCTPRSPMKHSIVLSEEAVLLIARVALMLSVFFFPPKTQVPHLSGSAVHERHNKLAYSPSNLHAAKPGMHTHSLS